MKKTEKSLKFMEHNKDDQYAHYRVSRMKRERKIAESLSEKNNGPKLPRFWTRCRYTNIISSNKLKIG